MYKYKVELKRIIDADTMDVIIDVGFDIKLQKTIRIRNYDAPETWRPKNENELKHGESATRYAKKLLEGNNIVVKTYKEGIYNRYIADIILDNGEDYASHMIGKGFKKQESEYYLDV